MKQQLTTSLAVSQYNCNYLTLVCVQISLTVLLTAATHTARKLSVYFGSGENGVHALMYSVSAIYFSILQIAVL